MVSVSFPGLGIGPITFDKVAFSVGKIEVRWYGILIVTGIILAFLYASWRAKQHSISFDDMLDVAVYTVLSGIIGARLYYVLMRLDSYSSFLEVISIWNGGLAIYGGIIGGSIALFIVCRVKKLNALKLFDCVSPGVMLAQAIGRWGNFFNGEAFGATPDESHPLYFLRMGLRHEGWSQEYIYQPDFLYESLWNLLGFILINIFYRRKKFDGQIFIMYLTWYGFGRMLIEGSRTDSLYLGVFRVSQVLGFLCFVIGTVLLIVLGARARRLRLAEGSYDSVYGRVLGERERGGRPAAAADAAAEAAEAGAEKAGSETEAAGDESAEAGYETAAGPDEKAGAEEDSGTDAYAEKPDGQSGGEA